MRVYRKLFPFDLAQFRAHLLRLSPGDRRCRFFGGISDAGIADYCARIDWYRTAIIGCFDGGTLRGAVELHSAAPLVMRAAEVAVTVEPDWQDRGIGTDLLRRAIVFARNRGLAAISMLCLTDNRRMQAIARKLDSALSFAEGDVAADLRLPFPTQVSLLEEAFADGAGLFGAWWDCIAERHLSPATAGWRSAPPSQ